VEEDNHYLFNLAALVNYIPETPGVVPKFVGQGGSTVEQNPNLIIPADIAAGTMNDELHPNRTHY